MNETLLHLVPDEAQPEGLALYFPAAPAIPERPAVFAAIVARERAYPDATLRPAATEHALRILAKYSDDNAEGVSLDSWRR